MVPANLIKREIINFEDCCNKENNGISGVSYENIEIEDFDIKQEITYLSNDFEILPGAEFSSQENCNELPRHIGSEECDEAVSPDTDKYPTLQSEYKCVSFFNGSSGPKKRTRSKLRSAGKCRSPAVTRQRRSKQVEKQLLQCDQCSHTTPRKDRMLRHMLTHPQLFPYIPTYLQTEKKLVHCQDCEFSTLRKDSLVRHMLTHSKLFPHACPSCSFRCNEAYGLKRHQATRHRKVVQPERMRQKKSNFKCEICGFESHLSCRLKVHMKTHESSHLRRSCDLCPFSTRSSESLRRHAQRCPVAAPPRVLSCPSCAYTTAETRHLQRHRNTHLGTVKNTHRCAGCGEYFNSKSLVFHRRERCKRRRSK